MRNRAGPRGAEVDYPLQPAEQCCEIFENERNTLPGSETDIHREKGETLMTPNEVYKRRTTYPRGH